MASSRLSELVLPGLFGLVGLVGGTVAQGFLSLQLERQKFETALIQDALKSDDDQKNAARLKFLVDVGLLSNINKDVVLKYAGNPKSLPTFAPPVIRTSERFQKSNFTKPQMDQECKSRQTAGALKCEIIEEDSTYAVVSEWRVQ
jgi:hypothetical protein